MKSFRLGVTRAVNHRTWTLAVLSIFMVDLSTSNRRNWFQLWQIPNDKMQISIWGQLFSCSVYWSVDKKWTNLTIFWLPATINNREYDHDDDAICFTIGDSDFFNVLLLDLFDKCNPDLYYRNYFVKHKKDLWGRWST